MSSIFGGGVSKASKQSQQAQLGENRAAQDFIRQMAAQSRGDVMNIMPQAIGTIGASVDPRISAIQQGSMGAQQTLQSTLPQIQNAILGLPVDMGFAQPQNVQVDTSFLTNPPPMNVPTATQQPQQQNALFDYSRMLGRL